jgi:hypothetical protein
LSREPDWVETMLDGQYHQAATLSDASTHLTIDATADGATLHQRPSNGRWTLPIPTMRSSTNYQPEPKYLKAAFFGGVRQL